MLIEVGVAVPTGNGVPRMYTLVWLLLRKGVKKVIVDIVTDCYRFLHVPPGKC